mgnify:CR=1 FL=1
MIVTAAWSTNDKSALSNLRFIVQWGRQREARLVCLFDESRHPPDTYADRKYTDDVPEAVDERRPAARVEPERLCDGRRHGSVSCPLYPRHQPCP